jgi:hypothetical protein
VKKRYDDCLRQCVARVVKRKPHRVPHFVRKYKGRWLWYLTQWCERIGYHVLYCNGEVQISEGIRTWINIGPSRKRSKKTKIYHAVVMKCKPGGDGKVVYDGGNGLRRVERTLIILKKRR